MTRTSQELDAPESQQTTATIDGTAAQSTTRGLGSGLLLTLGLLSGVAPLGTDLYLSALPAMTTDLSTTATGVQLSLTGFLVGSGVGQLVFGPWSDRKGRMAPLLSGLALFVVASIVATLAPNLDVLLIARLLQGAGASAGMVVARAIVLDREQGVAAARALNVMVMIGGVAPIIAPLFGSVLAGVLGWRGLLGIVAGAAVLSVVLTLIFVRESLPARIRAQRRASRAEAPGVWRVLTNRHFVGNLLSFGFGMGVLMAYISASPFIYQDLIGLGEIPYGVAFAVNAIGMLTGSFVANKLSGKYSLRAAVTAAQIVSAVGIVGVIVLGAVGAPRPSSWCRCS